MVVGFGGSGGDGALSSLDPSSSFLSEGAVEKCARGSSVVSLAIVFK